MAEKRLFNYAVETIKYYWSMKLLIPTESIFFYLAELSPLIESPMNLNCTKSKSNSKNGNLSDGLNINNRVDDEVLWANKLLHINSNQTKSENCSDYINMYNMINKEISSINPNYTENESCSDMCNAIGKEISFMEEIKPNCSNLYRSKSECHSNNAINTNHNVRKGFDNKEL